MYECNVHSQFRCIWSLVFHWLQECWDIFDECSLDKCSRTSDLHSLDSDMHINSAISHILSEFMRSTVKRYHIAALFSLHENTTNIANSRNKLTIIWFDCDMIRMEFIIWIFFSNLFFDYSFVLSGMDSRSVIYSSCITTELLVSQKFQNTIDCDFKCIWMP